MVIVDTFGLACPNPPVGMSLSIVVGVLAQKERNKDLKNKTRMSGQISASQTFSHQNGLTKLSYGEKGPDVLGQENLRQAGILVF